MEDLFRGEISMCMEQLEMTIECCKNWKLIYQNYVKNMRQVGKEWGFKSDSIFAQIEAFI